MKTNMNRLIATGMISAAWLFAPHFGFAHCDTVDGPVVAAARAALEKKEITPVLKWIKAGHEAELRNAFARTLAVRPQGRDARELADQFFFETLVRLHREGEGAPYTGLKPAGTQLEPAVEAADKALENGKVDTLVRDVTEEVAAGLRQRFAEAREKRVHAEHNVEAGREFVVAYVEYVHYVEGLHRAAQGASPHHAEVHEAAPAKDAHHAAVPQHKH